jgi:hypothetical protein
VRVIGENMIRKGVLFWVRKKWTNILCCTREEEMKRRLRSRERMWELKVRT